MSSDDATLPNEVPNEPPLDLAALTADDQLLDALGRGGPAPADDAVAVLLAAWHTDLDSDPPDIMISDDALLEVTTPGIAGIGRTEAADPVDADPATGNAARPVTPIVAGSGSSRSEHLDSAQGRDGRGRDGLGRDGQGHDGPGRGEQGDGDQDRSGRGDGGSRRGGSGRTVRWIAAAAAVILVAAGLLVAANRATPGSPFWPVTRVVNPERAEALAAEHAIARAREAAERGRYDDARRLADQAEGLIARVHDAKEARRLRAELESVRTLLAGARSTTAPPAPGGTPAPGGATSGPGAEPAPTAAPGPTTTGGATQTGPPDGKPGLPGLPAVPGLPLPTALPSVGVPPLPVPLPTPTSLVPPLPSLPVIGRP
jgi:hypothetical protein